ncbi:MAG: hypothetical protein AAFP15_18555 [Bacteroidota bacterium]
MPTDTKLLREQATGLMADAKRALEDRSRGEMDRAIEQSTLMEEAYNLLQQVAIIECDDRLLKMASEAASKWAINTRSATTKRRNDIVPQLVEAVMSGASWSEAAEALSAREVE